MPVEQSFILAIVRHNLQLQPTLTYVENVAANIDLEMQRRMVGLGLCYIDGNVIVNFSWFGQNCEDNSSFRNLLPIRWRMAGILQSL